MSYVPSQKVLEKYAKVFVNFALNSGKGIKKGDTVVVVGSEVSKPLYIEILKAIWKSGGNVIERYSANNNETFKFDRYFYENASKEQLAFFPAKLIKGQVDDADHYLKIIADTDLKSLEGIDSKKIMLKNKTSKLEMKWREQKEISGKLTWTLGLYGTEAMAKEANLSIEEYWNQIIKACYLDKKDPIKEWKNLFKLIENYRSKLNKLKIDQVHMKGPDVDLWIKIGEKRSWFGGSGRNIPSFEIFTSPDWRGTNGWIKFSEPLYRYGNLIEGIELTFKDGCVVKSKASKNEKVLKAMIATENANKVGEYSLTDKRFSRITKFMAETLYDENVGGPNGNSHIALGSAYKDCYEGDPSKVSEEEWIRLGYNTSSVHTDIVSTTPRTVTAHLKKGKQVIIYKNGQFVI